MEDNKLLLLEQSFKNYKEITDKQSEELKRVTQEQEKRIIQLEMNNTKTDLQYEQIMRTLNKLNEETIPNLTVQLEELKNKPAKRYDQIIGSVLGGIFGAVGGVIAGLIINLPK